MFRQAEKKEKEKILEFLLKDPVYNTFILADIEMYGFDKEFQKIYVDENRGEYEHVYLTFYNNLILAGQGRNLNCDFLKKSLQSGITVIMGKGILVEEARDLLGISKEKCRETHLYSKPNAGKQKEFSYDVEKAEPEDVDAIYTFLMSIEELQNMYQSREMLERRIKNNEGIHAFIKKRGEIVAHANTTARAEKSVMIGGIGVKREERGKKMASCIVSFLAEEALKEGRIPCVFGTKGEEESYLSSIGFEEIGKWNVLEMV